MRDAPNVSDRSRKKVLRAAEELGYRPNAFARSLASKKLHTIGVLVNDVTNPYFGGVYASLAKAAYAAGYDLLMAPGTRSASKELALVNTLLEHRVAGLALLSPIMKTSELRTVTTAMPTVVVGREVSIAGVDVVTTDERQAAQAVVARLVELGHRDIVHINGGGNRPALDRAAAYRETMRDFGLHVCEVPGSFTEHGGRAGGRAVLGMSPLPTAVVAANDLIAVGAMGVFQAAGLRVPEDLSVVGYDDSQIAQLPWCS
jgi:DNA-binding LacI/PurR family transcriptional regulator